MEVSLRNFSNILSIDIDHYDSFNDTIDMIGNSASDNHLFLGNSLTRAALNRNLINDFFDSSTTVGMIHPDDSDIALWYYILKLKFDSLNLFPENIIIIFANSQLQSKIFNSEKLRQIAEICTIRDIKFIIKNENLNFSNSIKLLIYKVSYSARYAQRISKRILVYLPHYKKTIRRLNDFKHKKYNLSPNIHMVEYYHLDSLIELASKYKSRLVFVSIYCGDEYKINKNLRSRFEQENIKFVNLKDNLKFNKNDLSDGYHLNELGANKFSNMFLKYYDKYIK